MSQPSLRTQALGAILLALAAMCVGGCGSQTPVASPTSSPTPVASPSPLASPIAIASPTTDATPYPLADGEAWIVLDFGGVGGEGGARLIRPDGTGSHEILPQRGRRVIEPTGAGEASATGDVVTVGEGYWRPTP